MTYTPDELPFGDVLDEEGDASVNDTGDESWYEDGED